MVGINIVVVLLVANSRWSRFNPPLRFISKGHGLKAHDISCY